MQLHLLALIFLEDYKSASDIPFLRHSCLLRSLLPTLENLQEANRLSRPALEQHKADASAEVQMWDLDAMAFNVPYTDTNTITSRILATNIHDNRRRDVQFVVGVYVHPIIHRIFSVSLLRISLCTDAVGS